MRRIPLAVPSISSLEQEYVADAMKSTWISSSGAYLDRFETEFADLCGTSDAIAVSNGTVALHLALAALGVGEGDEVIVPSLTYVASVNAVKYVGASPVFVDVDANSWCITPQAIEASLTHRTRAVIVVHLYGQPADMAPIRKLCKEHSLHLIEDAAEAPLATYRGEPVGGLGDIGTFSFYGNKVLTCGEGGALTTNDKELASKIRMLRGQGMDKHRRYWFPVIGFNYRLTNIAGAILCAQIERRKEILEARQRVYRRYNTVLEGQRGITFQPRLADRTVSPWLFSLLINVEEFGCSRDELIKRLDDRGVETRPFFPPIHTLPPYVGERAGPLPNTIALAQEGINLPTYAGLAIDDVDYVCDSLMKCSGKDE